MTVLAACVLQLALAAPLVEPGSVTAALADRVADARFAAHTQKLRAFVEQGSSGWMQRKPWTQDEWLKEVPPKYHPMIKEYFKQLEKMKRE